MIIAIVATVISFFIGFAAGLTFAGAVYRKVREKQAEWDQKQEELDHRLAMLQAKADAMLQKAKQREEAMPYREMGQLMKENPYIGHP